MTRYIEAVPQNGYVIHAVNERNVIDDRGFTFARAICGVTGRDGWGGGGMRALKTSEGRLNQFDATEPNPSDKRGWNGEQYNTWCPKCIRLVSKAVAS